MLRIIKQNSGINWEIIRNLKHLILLQSDLRAG